MLSLGAQLFMSQTFIFFFFIFSFHFIIYFHNGNPFAKFEIKLYIVIWPCFKFVFFLFFPC